MSTAAVIGYLDPAWLVENRDFVNTFVQDVSNPARRISISPPSVHLAGIGGTRGQKASSNLEMASVSRRRRRRQKIPCLHMVPKCVMEAHGNLILSVISRSFRNYFLMDSDNLNRPPNFIGNKVPGITF
jgi:endo-1,3(4)-beta-glucanase